MNGSSTPGTSPKSRITLVQKREESRCRIACSMPPMYWSTAIQYFARSSTMLFFWSGQAKRIKYQDESTKVSMVSVSRLAALPHFGHFQSTNYGVFATQFQVPPDTQST